METFLIVVYAALLPLHQVMLLVDYSTKVSRLSNHVRIGLTVSVRGAESSENRSLGTCARVFPIGDAIVNLKVGNR